MKQGTIFDPEKLGWEGLFKGVFLTKTLPNRLSDGRVTKCSVALGTIFQNNEAKNNELIRLYPIELTNGLSRWDSFECNIRKPGTDLDRHDRRLESWKIINGTIKYSGTKIKQINTLQNLCVDCLEMLKQGKKSLGIIKPNILGFGFTPNDKRINDTLMVYKTWPYYPYVRFKCSGCHLNYHELTILDLSFYEFLRKNVFATRKYSKHEVFKSAHFGEPEYNHLFIVGNQYKRWKTFSVVGIIVWKNTNS